MFCNQQSKLLAKFVFKMSFIRFNKLTHMYRWVRHCHFVLLAEHHYLQALSDDIIA